MTLIKIGREAVPFARRLDRTQARGPLLLSLLILAILFSSAFAGEKVFTNADLEKYTDRRPANGVPNPETRGRVKFQAPAPNPVEKPEMTPRFFGPVKMKISGCQTLQEGMDGKQGSLGEIVIDVNGKGRTAEEICDTLGQGCRSCSRAP
jgi:hypothetical protein